MLMFEAARKQNRAFPSAALVFLLSTSEVRCVYIFYGCMHFGEGEAREKIRWGERRRSRDRNWSSNFRLDLLFFRWYNWSCARALFVVAFDEGVEYHIIRLPACACSVFWCSAVLLCRGLGWAEAGWLALLEYMGGGKRRWDGMGWEGERVYEINRINQTYQSIYQSCLGRSITLSIVRF
jgi:hypothetical protein